MFQSTVSGKQAVQLTLVALLVVIFFQLAGRNAHGIPMFARRYGVPCSTCHTSPPRLNETGYQFRAAGFRMPEEIGKDIEGKTKLTDHIGFRLQPRFDAKRTSIGSDVETSQHTNMFAAEGYLWYGPISKYFSSNVKITIWPEESHETELKERLEGTLRFHYGKADNFFEMRAGVPHPMEGFGGSESYVISNTKPFIQDLQTANFNQDTFFAPFEFHQTGVTAGYYYKRTTIRGQILSGIRLKFDEDEKTFEAFGRKEPFSHAAHESDKGGPDFQLYVNQILHPEGGNVSLYYYKGQSYLPRLDLLSPADQEALAQASALDRHSSPSQGIPSHISSGLADSALARSALRYTASAAIGSPDVSNNSIDMENLPFFKNNFHRLAFYAGYPIKRVNLLYGIQEGRDTIGTGGHFTSLGQFAEASVKFVNDISAFGVRYDWLDPARHKGNNEMTGVTAYVNIWLHQELRITPEFQHLNFKRGLLQPERHENNFQLRLYWIR